MLFTEARLGKMEGRVGVAFSSESWVPQAHEERLLWEVASLLLSEGYKPVSFSFFSRHQGTLS
jgi:hypothetical protein